MTQIPDAPYIQEAERYGYPEAPEIKYYCPICGAYQPEYYVTDYHKEIIGCDECVDRLDAYCYEWERRDAVGP